MAREITINNKATVKANGKLDSNHCKRVVRLYPFTVYTSVADAAASICTLPNTMSRYLHDEKAKYLKGVQFCFLSELDQHLDALAASSQFAENKNNADAEDARKWREYQAEQEAIRKAEEDRIRAEQERIAAIERARQEREERKAKLKARAERRRRIIERIEAELQRAKERLNDTLVELDILCSEEESENEVSVA